MKPRTKAALLAIICILSFIIGTWLGYRFLRSIYDQHILWVYLILAVLFWIISGISVEKGNNIISK